MADTSASVATETEDVLLSLSPKQLAQRAVDGAKDDVTFIELIELIETLARVRSLSSDLRNGTAELVDHEEAKRRLRRRCDAA